MKRWLILTAIIAFLLAGFFVPEIDMVVATVVKIVVNIGGAVALLMLTLLAGFGIGSIKG